MAGKVLDQDAGEALQRAEHSAVDHYRRLLLRVVVDVKRAKSSREVEIDLRGAALPVAADSVLQHVLELRPVERAFPRVDRSLDAAVGLALDLIQHVAQRLLGLVPQVVGTRRAFPAGSTA